MEDQSKEPKRLQATPEEFERLLKGETVNLSLEGGKIHSCLVEEGNIKRHILVRNIEVKARVKITEGYDKTIRFSGNTKVKELIIRTRESLQNLDISGSTQIGLLVINGMTSSESIWITEKAKIKVLQIEENVKVTRLDVFGHSKVGHIFITDNSILDILECHGKSHIDIITLIGDCVVSRVSLTGGSSINKLNTREDSSIDLLGLYDQVEVGELSFFDCKKLSRVEFFGGVIQRPVVIGHMKIPQIEFVGRSSRLLSRLVLSQIKCQTIRFIDCHLDSPLRMTEVGPEDKDKGFLEFTRSSFDKLELVGNRFDEFGFLVFENSDITKAFIAETSFPRVIKSPVDEQSKPNYKIEVEKDFIVKYQQVKLFNEQLKIVHQSQGNRSDALKYQSAELDAHYAELNWGWDKATLAFNKYTTNFGTQWFRGLMMLFVIGLMLYVWLILFVGPKGDSLVILNQEFFSGYIDFINPTSHIWKKWDFLYELTGKDEYGIQIEPNTFIKIWLLFSKVVIVTMIYQIVQAFRKFGKR